MMWNVLKKSGMNTNFGNINKGGDMAEVFLRSGSDIGMLIGAIIVIIVIFNMVKK
jgi:hypothetical protein